MHWIFIIFSGKSSDESRAPARDSSNKKAIIPSSSEQGIIAFSRKTWKGKQDESGYKNRRRLSAMTAMPPIRP
jgi:hypothetical protein